MNADGNESRAMAWRRLAVRTAMRVNVAWWLAVFCPLAVGVAAVACAVVLYLRSRAVVVEGPWAWAACAGLVSVAAMAAWLRARRRFLSVPDAMVRLESRLGLNNALSAAAVGVGHWPDLPARADDGLRYDWRWTVVPLAGAFGLTALAFLIPVKVEAAQRLEVPPPRAHEEIRAAIEELKDTAQEEALKQLEQQLDALEEKPASEWYQHSSLEAADNLLASMRQEAKRQGEQLDRSARSLTALTEFADKLEAGEQQRLAQEFADAAKRMAESPLGLNQQLAEALSKLDPSALKQLSPDAAKAMAQRLKEAAGKCRNCAGNGSGGSGQGAGSDAQRELDRLLNGDGDGQGQGQGQGQGEGDGQDGREGAGRGGVQRGPGVAPLPMNRETKSLSGSRPEAVEGNDLTDSLPGDKLATSEIEHDVDRTAAGPVAGGAASGKGEGGEAIWREALQPQEKAVLQRYFK